MITTILRSLRKAFDSLFDSGAPIMTNPNTPREDDIQGLFNTIQTSGQSVLTSARGATDRQAQIISDLQSQLSGMSATQVDDETLADFKTQVDAAAAAAADAQAAFDQIGVPASPPNPDEPVGGRKKGRK